MKSIELFSGTGGLALGLQQAGFDHVALYEWDKHACENLEMNFGVSKVIRGDVRNVDFGVHNGVDLVAGGPPCQPFSLGGKSMAYRDSRDMFPEMVRAIRETMPRAFVVENVKGLLRKAFSTYFNYIILQLTYPKIEKEGQMTWQQHLSELERVHTSSQHVGLHYNVTFRLVDAANYGVPQHRYRVVIVGFRNDVNAKWAFPEPTHSEAALLYTKWISHEYWEEHGLPYPSIIPLTKEQLRKVYMQHDLFDSSLRWQTVRDAIRGLPTDDIGKMRLNHIGRGGAKEYPGHTGSHLDEPSKTIKAGAHGVPGGENMLLSDDGSLRYYTVRESARIQSFPDSFDFKGPWSESMRQIGNAVPVKLAKVIGDSVMKQLRLTA